MSSMTLMAFGMPNLESIEKTLIFLLMLSVLIVLHEGGHFLLARLNGVRVNDFAMGFGPTLLKWTSKRSGTNYRLNLFPIGGYCAMQGEDGKTSEAEQQREFRAALPTDGSVASDNFQSKSTWGRLSIIVAGPFANFVLAFAIYVLAAVTFGVASTQYNSTEIGPIQPGSPAAKAGMHTGDRIVSIDGKTITSGDQMVKLIQPAAGKPLRFGYLRDGAVSYVTIVPKGNTINGKVIGQIGFLRLPTFTRVGILAAIPLAADTFVSDMRAQISGIVALFSNPVRHFQGVSGVIGMGRAAAVVQDIGWAAYLELAATISIALGLLNLLPFPALDGGRAVFIVAEMLRGRPVDPEKEALVHVTGFAFLMVLMVFVAYHDISNIITGKGVF